MMNGKTILITGANGGIGRETTKSLAEMGARVIMACRNLETGRKIRDEVIAATGNRDVILKKLDLSSQKSIREFAEDFLKEEENLHVLIHNAGVWLFRHFTNAEGLELTMATNHFGPFLLNHLLIDMLKKSAPSRIVVVSSVSHFFGSVNFDQTNYVLPYFPMCNYFNSKFANVCFTRELARRLENSGVTANSVHPGMIDTDIWDNVPSLLSWITKFVKSVFFKTCKEGSRTVVYAATCKSVEKENGKYFVDCQKSYMSSRAFNVETTKKLWDVSEKIANLNDSDPKI